jgi:hypothetical protein
VRVRRPRFIPGQLVTADDLNALVDHVEAERRRHNLALHGSGVVRGLGVEVASGAIVVCPGTAVDQLGRLIELPEHVTVELSTLRAGGTIVVFAEEHLVEPIPTATGVEHRAVETVSVVAVRPAAETPGPADVVLGRIEGGCVQAAT